MGKNSYDNSSQDIQDDVQGCRMSPNVYLGDTGVRGATQTIIEIVSNSVDEARAGFGKRVNLTIKKDNRVIVEDFGRGIPMDWNPKKNKWNWWISCQKLHAGGKLKGSESRENYNGSAGQHGIGLTCTVATSSVAKVISRRDGYIYTVDFTKGTFKGDENKVLKKEKDPKGKNQQTGTIVEWLCDLGDVFTDIDFNIEEVKSFCKSQAICNDGVELVFKDERNDFEEKYLYEKGVENFIKERVDNDKNVIINRFSIKGKGRDSVKLNDYVVWGEIAFAFVKDGLGYSKFHHNSLPLEYGGSPKSAMEISFVDFFKTELKKKGLLKKELKFEDISDILVFVSSTFTQDVPNFENQTKKAIKNQFIQDFMIEEIIKQLKVWQKDNQLEFDNVCKQISINAESRAKAGEVKIATKQNLSEKMGMKTDRIKNFVDCLSKEVEERELFISEGLSAQSSLKQARNGKTQALMCIRGKLLNVIKADYSKMFSNELIMDIMKVIGTGVEVANGRKSVLGNFDINNRRFNKIILSADADVDGLHIVCLLLTMLWKLTPELIKQGYIYVLDTPLYEIKVLDGADKGKYFYAYSDEEMEKMCKGRKVQLARNKGLGEVDKEQMSIFLNPETRRLTRVTINDGKKAEKNFTMFMDKNNPERKDYMLSNLGKYITDDEEGEDE